MIPQEFQQYRAMRESTVHPRRREEDRTRCTGCLRPAERLTGDGYCDLCLRQMHGYDLGEQQAVVALLGGAVQAAMNASVPVELIRQVVDRATDEYFESNCEAMFRALTEERS
jgi:hypothetical protein